MADLRIVDAPLLSTVKGTEKIPTGGEGNFSVSVNQVADFAKLKWVLATEGYVDNAVGNVQADLNLHKNNVGNPHQVTKTQVGLGNVDNTADLDKPVSNATQSAIITANSGKADKSYVDNALLSKADKTYVDNQLTLKVNKVDVDSSLLTKADKTYVDNQLTLKVNKVDVDSSLLTKADKTYVDSQDSSLQSQIDQKATEEYLDNALVEQTNTVNTALSNLSTVASKFYPTLAQANVDIANIVVNQVVNIGEVANGGLWYKATTGATSLTKSPYDSLTQSKKYTELMEQATYDAICKAPIIRNLFDISRSSAASAIDANGAIYTSSSNSVSDFIEVLSSQVYKFALTLGTVAFYKQDKTYISQQTVSANAEFTTPANAFYLRFNQSTSTLAKQMLIKGSTLPASYLAFGYVDPATSKRNELTNARAAIDNAVPRGVNLFDKSRALQNYAMGGTGNPYDIAAWFVTDFIAVKGGNTYISNKQSGNNGGAEYDENGNFLRLFTVTANTAFTVSSDAFFIRYQVSNLTNLDSLMIVSGSTLPNSYKQFVSLQGLQDSMTVVSKGFDTLGLRQATRPNIFDLRTGQDDYALSNTNGAGYVSLGQFTTGIMPVSVGQNIFITVHHPFTNNVIVIFRSGNTFVSSVSAPLNSYVTVPDNVDGMQLSLSMLRRRYSLHVSVGTTKPSGYRSYLLSGDAPNQDAQIALLGDSFTDQIATAGGWQTYFVNKTGSTVISNFARSGRQVKDALKSADGSRDLTADDFVNATHVVIPLGTNDYGANRAIGTITDAVDGTTANTFYADVYKVLWQLFTWKPTLRVMWATPTIRGQFASTPAQPFYPAANSAGVTLQQYRQAIIEVCALFGVRVADQFANSGFNLINILNVTDDGLHPNVSVGQPLYGRTLAASFNLL